MCEDREDIVRRLSELQQNFEHIASDVEFYRRILRRVASHGSLDYLIQAPCIFCGYDGQDFWSAGTHESKCLMHPVDGADSRLKALRKEIRNLAGE